MAGNFMCPGLLPVDEGKLINNKMMKPCWIHLKEGKDCVFSISPQFDKHFISINIIW